MEYVEYLRDHTFAGNSFFAYLLAFLVAVGIYMLLWIFKKAVISRMRAIAERSKMTFDDAIVRALATMNTLLFLCIALYAASQVLSIPDKAQVFIQYCMIILVVIYAARALQKILEYGLNRLIERSGESEMLDETAKPFIGTIAGVIVWLLASLLILQNIGFNITALLGGLGIAGIAIGFALQNVLSDMFAYVSIFLDKPFKIGDFIIVGQDMGTVQHIGIKSTRIKTLEGQELVMSNKELVESRINNYKRMDRRRVAFHFGIAYETPREKIKNIPGKIEEIIRNMNDTTFDRAHFKAFGEYSLHFEVVYYLEVSEYLLYMDRQQDINLEIMSYFEKNNISFSYPTNKIYAQMEK